MEQPTNFFQNPKIFAIVLVLTLYVCWKVFFSSDDGQAPPLDPPPVEQPGEGARNSGAAPDDPDPQGSGGTVGNQPPAQPDLLEKVYETFNFPVLSVSSLGKILFEELGLSVQVPDSARSLKLEALESGGRPLGEILAGLLSPHDFLFFKQEKTLYVIPGRYRRESRTDPQKKENVRICVLETALRASWKTSFDLWVDTEPPTKLTFTIQPRYKGDEVKALALTVRARRERRPWFQQTVEAALGRESVVESKGEERFRLTVKPGDIQESGIFLEVKCYHESTISIP